MLQYGSTWDFRCVWDVARDEWSLSAGSLSRMLESDKNAILLHAQTTRVLRGRKALHHLVCVGWVGDGLAAIHRAVNVQSEVMSA